MSVPVGLALLWLVAGIAGVVIGFRTIRTAIRDIQDERETRENRAALLVADRLDLIDTAALLEQEQMETEFSDDIEAWLAARQRYEGAA